MDVDENGITKLVKIKQSQSQVAAETEARAELKTGLLQLSKHTDAPDPSTAGTNSQAFRDAKCFAFSRL